MVISVFAVGFGIWRIRVERIIATKNRRLKAIQRFYRHLENIGWFENNRLSHDHKIGRKPDEYDVIIDDISGFQTELNNAMLVFVGESQFEDRLKEFMDTKNIEVFDRLMTAALDIVGASHEVWRAPTLWDEDYANLRKQCDVCNNGVSAT